MCIGRTWAMAESIEPGELEAIDSSFPLPPAVVTQHAQSQRRFILLTTQVSYEAYGREGERRERHGKRVLKNKVGPRAAVCWEGYRNLQMRTLSVRKGITCLSNRFSFVGQTVYFQRPY